MGVCVCSCVCMRVCIHVKLLVSLYIPGPGGMYQWLLPFDLCSQVHMLLPIVSCRFSSLQVICLYSQSTWYNQLEGRKGFVLVQFQRCQFTMELRVWCLGSHHGSQEVEGSQNRKCPGQKCSQKRHTPRELFPITEPQPHRSTTSCTKTWIHGWINPLFSSGSLWFVSGNALTDAETWSTNFLCGSQPSQDRHDAFSIIKCQKFFFLYSRPWPAFYPHHRDHIGSPSFFYSLSILIETYTFCKGLCLLPPCIPRT